MALIKATEKLDSDNDNASLEADLSTVPQDAAPAEPATATAPAAPAAANLPAAPQAAGLPSTSLAAALGDDGFDDLNESIGFGSFPMVKLDKSSYEADGKDLGDSFNCVLLNARKKYLVKAFKGDDAPMVYTYTDPLTDPNAMDMSGTLVSAKLAEWRAQGHDTPEIKQYMEVTARMAGGAMDGTIVLLSIPPASVSRLAGHRAAVMINHGKQLSQVVTRCGLGPKIKTGNTTFFPWDFSVAKGAH